MSKVFNTVITTSNPVIRNHSVYGQAVLPGLAYIDILYQLAREGLGLDFRRHCLKRLTIVNPLIVTEEHPVKLAIAFAESPPGRRITITDLETEKLYVKAEIQPESSELPGRIAIDAYKRAALQCRDIETVYAEAARRGLVHYGPIKAEGRIYLAESGCLLELNVASDFREEAGNYLFHPALLDGAALAARILDADAAETERLFLPLHYESFGGTEVLQTRCYAKVEQASLRVTKDIFMMDLDFFNDAGEQVGRLKGFTAKRLRDRDQIDSGVSEAVLEQPGGIPAPTQTPDRLSAELPEAAANDSENLLREIVAKYLNQAPQLVPVNTGFFELGLESSQLLAVVQELENALAISLNPVVVFEFTTIATLAAHLSANYPAKYTGDSPEAGVRHGADLDLPPNQAVLAADAVCQSAAEAGVAAENSAAPAPIREDEIAIIGMAGRFPGAENIREFWTNLLAGLDCIGEVPASRWDWRRYDNLKSASGKAISKWGGFIAEPGCFDAEFFRISPREAETLDPQERLFLQVCWEAIEDAGYTPSTLAPASDSSRGRNRVGVFAGVMHKDYTLIGAEALARGELFPLALTDASIANRVSFFCNFQGPSMAVDTLCSSSLTAVHLAVESVQRGECLTALAGGVNLSMHPYKYLTYGISEMHSQDGCCHSFGQGGDGYVSGEGVGAVLLKPLSAAVRDQDHIYAVIKSSSVNHGGTVSGITVPSPAAQAEMIRDCLEKAKINPRTISCVEAHGTGTALGDPIEIQGLVKAYRDYTSDRQFCSLGSVKSNIGHAEAAAGICGLIKAALQLHHQTLVPSLHAEEVNPYLELDQSPFYIQQNTEHWRQPVIPEQGREVRYPRRAGLSSFGATGSNAHIILEEFPPVAAASSNGTESPPPLNPVIIPLAALNVERLREYARRLAGFLQEAPAEYRSPDVPDLTEVAYTLQVGRVALEERVAFVVRDVPELIAKLEAFADSGEARENCWRGAISPGQDSLTRLISDREAAELVGGWIARNNLPKVAAGWVKGLPVAWPRFYRIQPRRISLPTYPFAKEYYWLPQSGLSIRNPAMNNPGNQSYLHPLLHRNTSDLFEQRFSSSFSGEEFFLRDHIVKGRPMLPGVAYLEMALAALEYSSGGLDGDQDQNGKRFTFNDLVWLRPFLPGAGADQLHIRLELKFEDRIYFEIYSRPDSSGGQPVVHCQGSAIWDAATPDITLNLADALAQCSRATLTAPQCYAIFKQMGIEYGPGHQGIEELYVGDGLVLAKIAIPPALAGSKAEYRLHPALMDSALQASLGLLIETGELSASGAGPSLQPALPFSLDHLEILEPCHSEMWVVVRSGSTNLSGDSRVRKLDIDLFNQQGAACVRMKGFSTRLLEGELQAVSRLDLPPGTEWVEPPLGRVHLAPVWERIQVGTGEATPAPKAKITVVGGSGEEHRQILSRYPNARPIELQAEDSPEKIAAKLQAIGEIEHIWWLVSNPSLTSLAEATLISEQRHGVLLAFKTIKALLGLGYGGQALGWTVITRRTLSLSGQDEANPTHAGLHGLFGSLAKEYPNWEIRLVDWDDGPEVGVDEIRKITPVGQGYSLAYRDRQWFRQELVPLEGSPIISNIYKRGGVYVVIGGAGKIGEVWSEYLVRNYAARIVWIGRRPKDVTIQAQLERMAAAGAAPLYITADAADLQSLQTAYTEIKQHYSRIDGVVHSAMVFSEQPIADLDEASFRMVLAAKVDISVNMLRVFGREPLGLILFFSSMISFIKDRKLSHYASGCTFADAYARQLARLYPGIVKVMNWGYWGNEVISAAEEFQPLARIGMGLIEAEDGIKALDLLLSQPIPQMAFLKTTQPLAVEGMNYRKRILFEPETSGTGMRLRLLAAEKASSPEKPVNSGANAAERSRSLKGGGPVSPAALRKRFTTYLINLVSQTLKIPGPKIDPATPLEKYGIDSIIIVQMTNALREALGGDRHQIGSTLFFEHQTIDALVEYFINNQVELLRQLAAGEETPEFEAQSRPESPSKAAAAQERFRPLLRKPARPLHHGGGSGAEDGADQFGLMEVAVIGLAGRYPQAGNLGEFWENLKAGKNCITEIPRERFEWERYFSPEKGKEGTIYTKWGGFIDDIDKFDPLFFHIAPKEAERMDPQERLFLETAYASIEDAGYTPANLAADRKIGVFVGVMNGNYPTGAHYWSIANRVSYLLNFQGPSIAVDTACSASLTAIHLALESIYGGVSEVAIAGGVNLVVDPLHYIRLSAATMLSAGEQCKSFGDRADGFVDGEAVGALVLKPLTRAVADHDHIYGVIQASLVNAGGKTNGFMVPNPLAQAELIAANLKRAQVNARSVSYLEAHGTGTALGDPIEIAGLTKAFGRDTPDKQFCAIGSVKSNIGHSESAAGIAGITKILLQLKYGQLAPSINAQVLNPDIAFEDTPFVVQRELAEWKRPVATVNGNRREYPRVAAISSFGAGGANAHAVIREHIPDSAASARFPPPWPQVIIVLSAQNEAGLRGRVQRLLAALAGAESANLNLTDLAYTLQVGREAMEERLALIAGSLEELREKLTQFSNGKVVADLYYGRVKRNQEGLGDLAADEDMRETVAKWVRRRKYAKLGEWWVKGLTLNWEMLYEEPRPHRISLPTYPFARERYWMTGIKERIDPAASGTVAPDHIHPLLHRNTSIFAEQRFSSTFTGREYFLADHVVRGRRIMPGAAFLEMARAAVLQSVGPAGEERMGVRLINNWWLRPLDVGEQGVRVHVGVFPEADGAIRYQIYGEDPAVDGEAPIYCQGAVLLNPAPEAQRIDLAALRSQYGPRELSSDRCYAVFRRFGVVYGPAYQGIERVYLGEGRVLAKLSLPQAVLATGDCFELHPSLLDAAIQASLGLRFAEADPPEPEEGPGLNPSVLFGLEELEIRGERTPVMWARIAYSDPGEAAAAEERKIDIDLYNDRGELAVCLKGIRSRLLTESPRPGTIEADTGADSVGSAWVGTFNLAPVWETVPLSAGSVSPAATDRIVIIDNEANYAQAILESYPQARVLPIEAGDSIDSIAAKFSQCGTVDHILWIAPGEPLQSVAEDVLIQAQERGTIQVFRLIKALLQLGYAAQNLSLSIITLQAQWIYPQDQVDPAHAGLHGFAGSLAKEFPNWKIRLVDLEAGGEWPPELWELPADPQGNAWARRNSQWYRQKLVTVEEVPVTGSIYRRDGVYVVIGGAGGLGEVWSEYLIRKYQARIVWIGRRPLDRTIRAKLDRLAGLGPAPLYITADCTVLNELKRAYSEIKSRLGEIQGIIQAALVLQGQNLVVMEEAVFRAALAAKVDVSVRLAQVFRNEPLDFVLFFSSLNSYLKTRGQSNYAAGCSFKDAFARRLGREWPCAVKVINWGYWGGVGTAADSDEFQKWMELEGIGSIEAPEAMRSLELLLNGALDQMALVKTTKVSGVKGLTLGEDRITVYPERNEAYISKIKRQALSGLNKTESNQVTERVEALLGKLLWAQLQSMGCFPQQGTTVAALKTQAGIGDSYGRWLEESLAVLTRLHYLEFDGAGYRPAADTAGKDPGDAWEEWAQKKVEWLGDPNLKSQVILAETTLKALPSILAGRILATDVMFPNSSLKLVEGIYKNNVISDYYNEVLTDILIAYVQERIKDDPMAKIRLIEVGAGTGGTSALIFKKLRPYRDYIGEYCYTDISKAFLLHAEKVYGPENPYLTYQLFNVEESFADQGIAAGKYDIAIAANVLHAVRNIRKTLQNVKGVLQKNGLIILNELSVKSLFLHLTFGLLDGWWLYEDQALRIPGCPGLTPQNWQMALEGEGFGSVCFPAEAAHECGGQVIVAESDGIVRQRGTAAIPERAGQSANQAKPAVDSRDVASVTARQSKPVKRDCGEDRALIEAHIRETVTKKLAEALKIDLNRIEADSSFSDYGLDSILAIQLVQIINQALMIELESTILFDYGTVQQLTGYILARYREQIAATLAVAADSDLKAPAAPPPVVKPQGATGLKLRPGLKDSNTPKGAETAAAPEPIAIVGISGIFPMAADPQQFWQNLSAGRVCLREVPRERWDWRQCCGGPDTRRTTIKWGGFIDGVDRFDPLFFGIAPKEASIMDPQQRLLLTEVWRALEDAGVNPRELAETTTGVFIATGPSEYVNLVAAESADSAALMTTVQPSLVPNRISYTLNLRGPSEYCETGCSSSLVALHRAIQAIRRGECEQAIVGAANLILTPSGHSFLESMGFLSSSGEVKPFQPEADGFVRSEGVAAILIRPLSRAIAEHDHIYGLVKGTGVFHGGKGLSLFAPNANGMKAAMQQAFRQAGFAPQTVSYIEAHGISSPLGDGIEINALRSGYEEMAAAALTDAPAPGHPCFIGSSKPCIGHGEFFSGMAALIKVVAAMRHQTIPGTPRFTTLHEYISLEGSRFRITAENRHWESLTVSDGRQLPRRAAINSYGMSGVNAHAILEEYLPATEEADPLTQSPQLMVLSARDQAGLWRVVRQMLRFMEEQTELSLADAAYTLQVGREAMEVRLALVVNNREELIRGLSAYLNATPGPAELPAGIPVFTGNLEADDAVIDLPQTEKDGQAGATKASALARARDLAGLAYYWVQGGRVPWTELHAGAAVRKISLPTYPFAQAKYWVSSGGATPEPGREGPRSTGKQAPVPEPPGSGSSELREYLIGFLEQELQISRDKIGLNKDLQAYGADSIVIMKLIRNFDQSFAIKLSGREIMEYRTVNTLANYLALKLEKADRQTAPANSPGPVPSQPEPGLNDERLMEALERFKQGSLTLEEIQKII